MLSYWQKPRRNYAARSGSVAVSGPALHFGKPSKEEAWRERFHGHKARCPSCNRWQFMRLLSDTWRGFRNVRLQCACGYCFTWNASRDDHLLVRTSGKGARGTYRPLGYRRFQADEKVYYD